MAAMAMTGAALPDVSGLNVGEAARRASLFENLKSCVGTLRRIVSGKR